MYNEERRQRYEIQMAHHSNDPDPDLYRIL